MKTAILISGQARTFARCFDSQAHHVYRKFADPHFFVSVASDEDRAQMDQLAADFPNVHVEAVEQPSSEALGLVDVGGGTAPGRFGSIIPADAPSDKWHRYTAALDHAPHPTQGSIGGVLRQFWQLQRAWKLLTAHAKPGDFSAFVRLRPDSFFRQFTLDHDMAFTSAVLVPWWGSWGGVNDRFALIMSPKTAEHYFNTFDEIDNMIAEGCPFHPESLLAFNLERARVPVLRVLGAEFCALRKKGDHRHDDEAIYVPGDALRYIQSRAAMPRAIPQVNHAQAPSQIVTKAPAGAFGRVPR